MLILSIDTSTIAASAAIMDEQKLHGEFYTDYKLKHSEKLLPLVQALLDELHMDFQSIDAYAVTAGPGSFTGLRIGAATVKAFAHTQNKPIIGVSTLLACAYGQRYFTGTVCPILDAQQNSVYSALFDCSNGTVHRKAEDKAIPLEELFGLLEHKDKVLFCGDAVLKFKEEIANEMGERAQFADGNTVMPRASYAAMAALSGDKELTQTDYTKFLPNYIRPSQAEANFSVKLGASKNG
jgi:tRNA threonylcarbamoyladenosine biosynthesis protein TsaB